jgi:aspartate/methionine/tyrosine aminotransferase
VFLIPGSAFGATNHVRLVIASPNEVMKEACERIKAFCADHYVA